MAYIEKRVSKKTGRTTFRVQVRVKGAECQSATFNRLTDAREWGRNTESAIKERRYFKTAEAKKHTVADLVDRYFEYLGQRSPKRLKDVDHLLLWWRKELGYCILADLSKALILEKVEKLAAYTWKVKSTGKTRKRSPATCNRYMAALSHALSVATDEWEWLEINPMNKIKKFKEPRGRTRFLNDEEREKLLKECKASKNPILYTLMVLSMSTGARVSEVINLTWKQIHLDRNMIILDETKNGEQRALYLSSEAYSLIQQRSKIRRIDSDLVFPAPNNPLKPYDFRNSWRAAIERAGIEDFVYHDLRHTAASYLAMRGASTIEIAQVLGHKTLEMVKRYAHLSNDHVQSLVTEMNEEIFDEKSN